MDLKTIELITRGLSIRHLRNIVRQWDRCYQRERREERRLKTQDIVSPDSQGNTIYCRKEGKKDA